MTTATDLPAPLAQGTDLTLEQAARVVEDALRETCKSEEEIRSLQVRPSLHFTSYGGTVADSLEIFLRDRTAAIPRANVVRAFEAGAVPMLIAGIRERLSGKHPHPSEVFTRIQVLREEVNQLWEVIALALPGEALAIQQEATDGFPTLFPETWRGKPTHAAHLSEICRRLKGAIIRRLNPGAADAAPSAPVPAAAPAAPEARRRGRPRKEKNA